MAKKQGNAPGVGTSIAQDGRKPMRPSRLDVTELFAKPPEHPRLCHPDGARAHSELERNRAGRRAVDGGSPERLPGALLELAPDQVECLAEEPALGVPFRCAGLVLIRQSSGGKPREPDLGLGPPAPPGSRPSLRKWSRTLFWVMVRSHPGTCRRRVLCGSPRCGLQPPGRRPGRRRRSPAPGGPSGGTSGRPGARRGRPVDPMRPDHRLESAPASSARSRWRVAVLRRSEGTHRCCSCPAPTPGANAGRETHCHRIIENRGPRDAESGRRRCNAAAFSESTQSLVGRSIDGHGELPWSSRTRRIRGRNSPRPDPGADRRPPAALPGLRSGAGDARFAGRSLALAACGG